MQASTAPPRDDVADLMTSFIGRRVQSSLLLQQLLYYNASFSVCWFVVFVARIIIKYGSGLAVRDPDAARTATALLWLLAEPVRLYLGYAGNLGDHTPALAAFAALSVAPQTAVAYYLMLAAYDRAPLDVALQVVAAALLHLETAAALVAAARMAREQGRQFRAFTTAALARRRREEREAALARRSQQRLAGSTAAVSTLSHHQQQQAAGTRWQQPFFGTAPAAANDGGPATAWRSAAGGGAARAATTTTAEIATLQQRW